MDETRVDRYKEYRNSFIKEGAISSNPDQEADTIDVKSTSTSTLPIDQVLDTVKDEKQKDQLLRQSKMKHLGIVLIKIGVSLILLAGLALLGYFAWR